MDIKHTNIDGALSFSLLDVESVRKQESQAVASHMIEIAYKTKYHCNMCKMLLPPTFEVDHIVALCDGGKDEYDNLQALCPNCRALKTEANILRRDKVFKKEFGR